MNVWWIWVRTFIFLICRELNQVDDDAKVLTPRAMKACQNELGLFNLYHRAKEKNVDPCLDDPIFFFSDESTEFDDHRD